MSLPKFVNYDIMIDKITKKNQRKKELPQHTKNSRTTIKHS